MPGGEALLSAMTPIFRPLLALLVRQGVDYTVFAAILKRLFIQVAEDDLSRRGQKVTDSALSLLSGVHRKDIREWRLNGLESARHAAVPISTQVFTKWISDPAYAGAGHGLKRLGSEPSFETLVRSVSSDVHPFTVLNELIRLRMAHLEEYDQQEFVVLDTEAFVPPPGSQALLDLFRDNVADHVMVAAANLSGQPARLEQSVFAGGISRESAEALEVLSRSLWAQAQQQMIEAAREMYEADKSGQHHYRIRFGSYFFSADESVHITPTGDPAAGEKA